MPITRAKRVVVALFGVMVVLGNSTSASIAPPESFDKPIRTRRRELRAVSLPTPNSHARIQLSCFYYPDIMVKELDDRGLKGVRWITITSVTNQDATRMSSGAYFYRTIYG